VPEVICHPAPWSSDTVTTGTRRTILQVPSGIDSPALWSEVVRPKEAVHALRGQVSPADRQVID
jgi:hypothetical protein